MADDPFADFPAQSSAAASSGDPFAQFPAPTSAGSDDPFAQFPSATNAPVTTPEQRTIAEHPELAPPSAPGRASSIGDVAQGAASGLASIVPDVLGYPMDALRSDVSSGPIGMVYGAVTGKPLVIPTTIGTSEWLKQKVRDFGGAGLIDSTSTAPGPTLAHAAAEYLPQLFVGGGESDLAKAAEQSALRPAISTADALTAARMEGAAKATANPLNPTKVNPNDVVFDASGIAKAPEPAPIVSAPTPAAGAGPAFSEAAPDVIAPHVELATDVQNSRAATLRAIGLNEARESAITGDAKAGASDFQTSKLDGAVGDRAASLIDNEQKALADYSGNLVDNTGGRGGTDQNALVSRGTTMLKPLDDLGDYFDANTKTAYAKADERAKGLPLDTPALHTVIADESNFLGTTEGEALLKGVKSRMRALGMTDADGNALPATVRQAEQFKQYLNNQWQPRTARLIRSLKDATDYDVTKAAGEDVYQEARANRALRARTLDDPNGIAKLIDSSGPSGINRAVAVEKIPSTLANLSVDQFAHVIKTLKGVPPELKPQADAALRAIKAHFASSVQDAGANTQGAWKNKAVADYLNDNVARMQKVFTPDEMAQFKTLNEAGHILHINRSYPGAAAQTHNLLQRGVLTAADKLGSAGAVVGSHAGPVGTIAGMAAGAGAGKAARAFVGKTGLAAFNKARVRKL